ncbi:MULTISPECIES: hypothetical protein [unclassified Moraxella]|uniref:hypothetical protein n=1 Tax=unclassified Moraxella TaxID=2685852 RepID=UPI003AF78F61
MKKLTLLALATSVISTTFVGCATTPSPEYISPNTYQTYDCNALSNEYNRVTQYINANQHQGGLTMSGVGIGIGIGRGGIYPNISLGVGQANTANRSNLAIAMGQRDAMIQSARLKQCGFAQGLKLSSEK